MFTDFIDLNKLPYPEYRDVLGAIHNRKNPSILATENPPLFYGTYIVLAYANNKLTWEDCYNFVAYTLHLFQVPKYELNEKRKLTAFKNRIYEFIGWNWRVTPKSDRYDFSKDNWIGTSLALRTIMNFCEDNQIEYIKGLQYCMDNVRLFHRQLLHPVDWCTVAIAKHGWTCLKPIVALGNIVSCAQTHKKRHGVREVKTDGKILALITVIGLKWDKGIFNLIREYEREQPYPKNNDKIVKLREKGTWKWWSLRNVFLDYFLMDENFPSVVEITRFENSHSNDYQN